MNGPCLMRRLDDARGHAGEYDAVSYALCAAAVEWTQDWLHAEGHDALADEVSKP